MNIEPIDQTRKALEELSLKEKGPRPNEQRSILTSESVEAKRDAAQRKRGQIDDENRGIFKIGIESIFRMIDPEEKEEERTKKEQSLRDFAKDNIDYPIKRLLTVQRIACELKSLKWMKEEHLKFKTNEWLEYERSVKREQMMNKERAESGRVSRVFLATHNEHFDSGHKLKEESHVGVQNLKL